MLYQFELQYLIGAISLVVAAISLVFAFKSFLQPSTASGKRNSPHHDASTIIKTIESDTALLKQIAILSMMFLPGSFIAGLFATEIFSWENSERLDERNIDLSMRPQFELYWAIALSLTGIVFGLSYSFHSWTSRRREIPHITDPTERALLSRLELDGTSTRVMAVVAMIFLPTSLLSTLIPVYYLEFELPTIPEKPGNSPGSSDFTLNAFSGFKPYWIVTLPHIVIAFGLYCFYHSWTLRRRHEKSFIADSTIRELPPRIESNEATLNVMVVTIMMILPSSFIFLFSVDFSDLGILKTLENDNITLMPIPAMFGVTAGALGVISLVFYTLYTARDLWNSKVVQGYGNASMTRPAVIIILLLSISCVLLWTMSREFCESETLMCLDKLDIVPNVLERLSWDWIVLVGSPVLTLALAYYFRKQPKPSEAQIVTLTVLLALLLALIGTVLGIAQVLETFRQASLINSENLELSGKYEIEPPNPGLFLTITIPFTIITFLIFSVWIFFQLGQLSNDSKNRLGTSEAVPETLSTKGLASATVILMPRGSVSILLLIRIFMDGLKSTLNGGNQLGAGIGSKLSLTLIPITLGSHRLYYWWNGSSGQRNQASTSGHTSPESVSELVPCSTLLNNQRKPDGSTIFPQSTDQRSFISEGLQGPARKEGASRADSNHDRWKSLFEYPLTFTSKILRRFQSLLQSKKTTLEFNAHRFITNTDHSAIMNSRKLYDQINRHLDDIPFSGLKILNVVHENSEDAKLEDPKDQRAKSAAVVQPQRGSFFPKVFLPFYERVQAFISDPTEVESTAARSEILRLRLTLRLLIGLSTLDLGLCIGTRQTELASISTTLLFMGSSIIGHMFLSWRFSKFHDKDVTGTRDIVVITRNSGFAVIKCSKEVASELEEKEYRTTRLMISMLISIASTIPTPSSTLLNTFVKRKGITPAASLINLLFVNFPWCLDLIKGLFRQPRTCVCEVSPSEDYDTSDMFTKEEGSHCDNPSFLKSLGHAIRETKRVDWVQTASLVPDTPNWRKWLNEAEESARNGISDWDAVSRKHEIDGLDFVLDQDIIPDDHPEEVQPRSVKKLVLNTFSLYDELKATVWWKHMFRPPVLTGHERLEWICECGRPLFGDFRNPSLELKDKLATTRSKSIMQAATAAHSSSTGTVGQSAQLTAPNRAHMRQSATRQVGWSNPPSHGLTSPSTFGQTSTTAIQPVVPPQMCVLVCLKFSKRRTKAEAVWYHKLTTDGDVFVDIRNKYHEARPSRLPWSLRLIHPVKAVFIKFLFEKAPVMSRIAGTEERPSIPPKEFVDDGKYHYTPCPLEEQPMPSDTFLHFLMTQDAHDQRLWGPRLPKKIHDQQNSMPSFTANWGVQIEEGPNWAFIFFLMFVIVLLSGLVAGIYGWKTGDSDTAVAIGTWMTTLQGIGLTTLYFFYT